MVEIGKKVFFGLWILLIVSFFVAYLYNPAIASPQYIRDLIEPYGKEMILVYFLLSMVRGLFLIPSTPFVIGGAMLFPDNLLLVLTISMVGVMASATALYYFSDLLGFSKYLEGKHSSKIDRWKERLQSRQSILFVLAWSVFPLVPTDLICYVAGIVKMPYRYMFIGVFFGELLLDIFYVFFWYSL